MWERERETTGSVGERERETTGSVGESATAEHVVCRWETEAL